MHLWCIMLCYLRKGKSTTEMQKEIFPVYGKGVVTNRTCQTLFAKFIGTADILPKKFFAVGLSYALEDV